MWVATATSCFPCSCRHLQLVQHPKLVARHPTELLQVELLLGRAEQHPAELHTHLRQQEQAHYQHQQQGSPSPVRQHVLQVVRLFQVAAVQWVALDQDISLSRPVQHHLVQGRGRCRWRHCLLCLMWQQQLLCSVRVQDMLLVSRLAELQQQLLVQVGVPAWSWQHSNTATFNGPLTVIRLQCCAVSKSETSSCVLTLMSLKAILARG